MAVLKSKELKSLAARHLEETSSEPRKLVFIHTGIIVGMSLLFTALNLLLNDQIGTTGGFSGLGLRSVLQTAQTVLSYCSSLITPFLQAGLLYAMISIARSQEATPRSLLRGFQRFGQILGYQLWQMLITMALAFGLMYAASFLFVLTPFAGDFLDILEPLMTSGELLLADGTINVDLLPVEQMFSAMVPLLLMSAALLIPVHTWVRYHLRMTSFLLVEGEHRGAVGSMLVSMKLMKGHKWQLLKLDISFWWYYLLEALLMVVLWLDVLLPLFGVPLPVDSTTALFIATGLYGLLELGLHLWKKPQVDLTYACAYEAIYREYVPAENNP